ncbi:DUF5700 domain-containing putative Zn-dependent protease [Chryseobacterium sp.]|uniref:DUF5700 domain-containing putative Zn-dependent protease n=1 Tax=Chryseobacterium sp. TaxID=1871047 RepID=UPI00289D8A4B|nr:DUF5700 domain-containing putative Zn-dependent protease [Chryseobacterium sp.]
MIKRLLLIICILQASQFLYSQKFDDSACWEYFRITDKLKKDQPVDPLEWKHLMKNEAIQVYLKDQGVDSIYTDNYRKIMETVYMPKNEAKLQQRLKDPYNNWWTYIINEYKINEDKMKAYLKNIEQQPEKYLDLSYQYSYQMLPKKDHKKAPEYKITIIPIHNDAHVENGWMIYTLLAAYFNDYNKMGILGGHEFQHVLRPRMDFDADQNDLVIVSMLQRILNEGSADLIDKRYQGEDAKNLLEFQRGYPESFLSDGYKTLKNIDSLLSVKPLEKSQLKLNKLFKGWNTSGHIPGYYMANIIEKAGYKKQLIKHIEDPFNFVYLYNKSAKRTKDAYVISDQTITVIEDLDKKYRPKSHIVRHQ